MSKKTLIFIRHAHRETSDGRHLDNGLSEKGKSQAKEFRDELLEKFSKKNLKKAFLISSPKKRCIETLEPLAKALDLKIIVESDLGEGAKMSQRVQSFSEWLVHEAPEFVVACSHGDVIPEFIEHHTGKLIDIRKGQWVEFAIEVDASGSAASFKLIGLSE